MNYKVSANGEPVRLSTATVFPMPYNEIQVQEYAQFQMNGPVDLRIQSECFPESVVIRPLSLGLECTLSGHEICIRLEKPSKFSVEINGSYDQNLLVFAEEEKYANFDPYGERVVYFPGGVHETDSLNVREDHTVLYLEEGALLHGRLDLEGCRDVTVCGYGAVSLERYPREMRPTHSHCLDVRHCQGVTIRDITILDSQNWSLRIFGCDNVAIDNVKIFGCRGNSDGIDICGSRNVLVQNIFTRVWDDSFVVKAFDTGDVENVLFRDSTLWNDFARPLEVGVELRAAKVRNVRFENIDILHSPTGYPLMGIHHGDRAEVSEITFQNIRIEDTPGAQLFDIRITDSCWNEDEEKGGIRNILFQDIFYLGKPGMDSLLSQSRLQGFGEDVRVDGVTFDNVQILGKSAADALSLGLLVMDYVDNVQFRSEETAPKIVPIRAELSVSEAFALAENGRYRGRVQVSLRNTGKERQASAFRLQISPAHTGDYDKTERPFTLEAGEGRSYEYEVSLPPGKYVLAVQSKDPNITCAWQFLPLDWRICETEKVDAAPELEFVNYYGVRRKGVKASVHEGKLLLHSELLQDADNTLVLYAAMPVDRRENEVVFSVEETDFGVVPAILSGRHGLEAAPQLRCPLEITLVFENEPKVKEIRKAVLPGGGNGTAAIPLRELGLDADTRHFWLEIEARTAAAEGYRYPYTLFHSVIPETSAHMFANVIVDEEST